MLSPGNQGRKRMEGGVSVQQLAESSLAYTTAPGSWKVLLLLDSIGTAFMCYIRVRFLYDLTSNKCSLQLPMANSFHLMRCFGNWRNFPNPSSVKGLRRMHPQLLSQWRPKGRWSWLGLAVSGTGQPWPLLSSAYFHKTKGFTYNKTLKDYFTGQKVR